MMSHEDTMGVIATEAAEAAAGSSPRTCSVTRQQVEYWLQEKRPDGNWFDYAKKDSLKICDTRIEELKSEKPGRTFRPIARIITDKDMSPNDQAHPAAAESELQESKKLNEAHLYDYPTGTALIRYRDRGSGKTNDWFIGAVKGKDTAETLEAHLRHFKPNAEFIGWVIK